MIQFGKCGFMVLQKVHLQARFNATHICFREAALDGDKGHLDELREMLVFIAIML